MVDEPTGSSSPPLPRAADILEALANAPAPGVDLHETHAPLDQTHEFNIDRNNIGPRVGVAWNVGGDAKTVVALNRAIVIAEIDGPARALEIVEATRVSLRRISASRA